MDLGLAGKIAIVTGGSKGIGRATALALAQEGVDVAICARGVDELEDAAADIRARTGRRALAVRADTGVAEDIQNLVATTVAELGGVDILINNAVNSTAAPFMELADEDWLNHINVKIMGYVRCARECIPHMRQRGGGRIINIGGMAARYSNPLTNSNGVTNASVSNMAKNLADPGGIRRHPGQLHPPGHYPPAPPDHAAGAAGPRRQHHRGGSRSPRPSPTSPSGVWWSRRTSPTWCCSWCPAAPGPSPARPSRWKAAQSVPLTTEGTSAPRVFTPTLTLPLRGRECRRGRRSVFPSPSGGGLGWGRLPVLCALCLIVLAAACGGSDVIVPPTEEFGGPEFAAVVVTSDLGVGKERLAFGVVSRDGPPITGESATVRTYYLPPNTDAREARQSLTARFEAWPFSAGVFAVYPDFDVAGTWELETEFKAADGQEVIARSAFAVKEASDTPAVGSPAPASVTPLASESRRHYSHHHCQRT